MKTLLQIVPRVPGGIDGVGDYSLLIARKLRDQFGCDTLFATLKTPAPENAEGFEVVSLEQLLKPPTRNFDDLLLHYVNYGFQRRGVPFRLLSILRELRERHRCRMLTVFHELYASGPPWTSAFWLQPFQIELAKSVARLSDACFVSSDHSRREVRRLVPTAEIELHPVPSVLGEPELAAEQIANRDPHRWAIFGGTALAERSLRSFRKVTSCIPKSITPHELFALGGEDNPATRALLVDLGIKSTYRPRIPATEASEVLRTCSFAWFDYFHRPDVETAVILKSSAFAFACAHAVIPVLPHCGSDILIDGDKLPGPFFVASDRAEIPDAEARAGTAADIYGWYRRHALSEHPIGRMAEVLGLGTAR